MTDAYLRTTSSNRVEDIANWASRIGSQGWIILESYPVLTFKRWKTGEPLPELGAEFIGRMFGDKGELRWMREGDKFDLWLLEDAGGEGESTGRYQRKERYYYALGYWSAKDWSAKEGYWEPKLPKGQVQYPLEAGSDKDRPRFKVFEYYRTPPADWPTGLDELEDLLNQPTLAAYRLVGFDAGRDNK